MQTSCCGCHSVAACVDGGIGRTAEIVVDCSMREQHPAEHTVFALAGFCQKPSGSRKLPPLA
ncbi:hypothetical protein, partial [Mesorhizobium sp.]|uniref:hypothetical protein n=1 Tax=Mesorhizobium sp. TaxID=1871066 RepID=UPI002611624B